MKQCPSINTTWPNSALNYAKDQTGSRSIKWKHSKGTKLGFPATGPRQPHVLLRRTIPAMLGRLATCGEPVGAAWLTPRQRWMPCNHTLGGRSGLHTAPLLGAWEGNGLLLMIGFRRTWEENQWGTGSHPSLFSTKLLPCSERQGVRKTGVCSLP
jgi:hypothetical protein